MHNPSGRVDDLLSEFDQKNATGPCVEPEDLCRDCPELLSELKRRIDALRRVPSTLPHTNVELMESKLPARMVATVEFDVIRSHARGGLGEVMVARDRTLGRDVAVKRIRPPFDAEPARRIRFLREAEVTGRLEHPGIAPVYGLGEDDAGKPCYAMRLVQGETLRDAIRRFHSGPGKTLAFRDLLARFLVVCQVAAYAHARGFIHRDIKPANVVIGPFGETILLDWGLAKEFASADPEARTDQVETIDSSATPLMGETAPGAVMGTPGFMAPEQATGRNVGPPADVYSLGATLFNLLTDRAPSDPNPPVAAAPPALLAVARMAMAARPEDRYASAVELADDVTRWLADEPVAAFPEPAMDRIARWGRRHRTFVRAGAFTLTTCVVVLAIAAVLLKRSGDRERSAADLASRRKLEAEAGYRQARRAVDDLFVSVSEGRLKTIPGAQPIRKDLLQLALKYYREFLAEHADDRENRADIAATYTKVGMIVGEVETAAEAITWHDKAVAEWRELSTDDPNRSGYRRELAGALDRYGLHLNRAGRLGDALKAQEEAVASLEAQLAVEPDNDETVAFLSRALVNLSNTQGKLGRNADAVRTGERGLILDGESIRRRPGDLVFRRNVAARSMNLGLDLSDLERTDEAIRILTRSRALYSELCDELDAHPERAAALGDAISNPGGGLAQAELNLGLILLADEQYSEGRKHLLAATARARTVSAANPTVRLFREVQLAAATNAVSAGLELGVPAKELLAESDQACGTGKQLTADDASNPDYRARFGLALAVRGSVLARMGRGEDAKEEWKAATANFLGDGRGSATFSHLRNSSIYFRSLGRLAMQDVSGAAQDAQQFLDGASNRTAVLRMSTARLFARCAAIATGEARTKYEDLALEQLQAAVTGGYRRTRLTVTDAAFSSIKERREFKALILRP